MGLNSPLSMVLMFVLAGTPAGAELSEASGEAGTGSIDVAAGFAAWTEALEADTRDVSSWKFPFDAPGPANLSMEELEIVLSLRRLVQARSLAELETLADQVERRQGVMPAQMRFWQAYAQGQLHQEQASLSNLKLLLAEKNGWENLDHGQRAWVLTGTPDLLFRLGDRDQASDFYTRLASSSLAQLNLWGTYQLAGTAFLARDFDQAATGYSLVCEAEMPGAWREHACAMAEITGRLSRLGREGETDDAVAAANP